MGLFHKNDNLDELQKIVIANVDPAKTRLPKSQLVKAAYFVAPQLLRQAEESLKLVNETANPQVFFNRYDFLIDRLKELSVLEKHIKLTGEKPSQALARITEAKNEAINDFINRSYEKLIDDMDKLKTEKTKQSKIEKYFSALVTYNPHFCLQNIKLIDALKEKAKHLTLP